MTEDPLDTLFSFMIDPFSTPFSAPFSAPLSGLLLLLLFSMVSGRADTGILSSSKGEMSWT